MENYSGSKRQQSFFYQYRFNITDISRVIASAIFFEGQALENGQVIYQVENTTYQVENTTFLSL